MTMIYFLELQEKLIMTELSEKKPSSTIKKIQENTFSVCFVVGAEVGIKKKLAQRILKSF